MTGSIYIIRNKVNEKVYIGKTYKSIHCRFKEHLRESRKKRAENRKLYKAIIKYGEINFYVELLEANVLEELLSDREVYFIKIYNSFFNGYNTTCGGDGSRYITTSDSDIINYYIKSRSVRHTARNFKICEDTVSLILHNNGINVWKSNAKKISIVSMGLEFESVTDCIRYLVDNKYTTSDFKSIHINIKRGIKRGSGYLGLKFKIYE